MGKIIFKMGILIAFLFTSFVFTIMNIGLKTDVENVLAKGKGKKFKVAWSIYVGWMPWPYAQQSGILKKWADAYGIEIELQQFDYVPSIDAYTSKQVDGVLITNMETLDMPATSGIDSRVVIVGDFSNDNDQVLARPPATSLSDLKGQKVYLVEGSVSHYLLVRGLEKNNMHEKDVTIVNTSDADIAPVYISNSLQKYVVTWNPMVMKIAAEVPGVKKLFGSADIPGEVLDLLVLRSDVVDKNPELAKALTGAWYEVMDLMSQRGKTADNAMSYMAEKSGATLTEFKGQLKTTAMFYTPQSAYEYVNTEELKKNMNTVRNFCFGHKLLGENATSVDVVGISYPDGTIQGDYKNIKIRFDDTFMKMAADGALKVK